MNAENIAEVVHEINRAYCMAIGEDPNICPSWGRAPSIIKDSAIKGVESIIRTPSITPEESHQSWCEYKTAEGWVWGEEKDIEAKTHPCLVPYIALPEAQKNKDKLFGFAVRMLAGIK